MKSIVCKTTSLHSFKGVLLEILCIFSNLDKTLWGNSSEITKVNKQETLPPNDVNDSCVNFLAKYDILSDELSSTTFFFPTIPRCPAASGIISFAAFIKRYHVHLHSDLSRIVMILFNLK